MSKYKYTSLLSSQYRQVFKSYHSLDRTEQELKDNLNKSLHKRIQTEVSQIEARNSLLHYQKPQFASPVQKPDTYLYYKNHSKYASTPNELDDRNETNYYRSSYDKRQSLSRTTLNRFNTLPSDNQFNTIQQRSTITENDRIRVNYQKLANNYNNYELKTKASQINKRRNDIKLNARVKDIDKINRKYDYLAEPNSSEAIKTNQSSLNPSIINSNPSLISSNPSLIQSTQQNEFKKSQTHNFTSSRQFSNCSIDRNAKNHQQIVKIQNLHSSPLLQTNSNKLQMIKSKQSQQLKYKEIKQLKCTESNQKYKESKTLSKPIVSKLNDEQNIQTPHFHQAQVKKGPIEPSLISLKLQSLVKNTFTDRF